MKQEYKEVYDLVGSLGYSCGYLRCFNGVYTLKVYNKRYNSLEDRYTKLEIPVLFGLDYLKETIKDLGKVFGEIKK